MLHETDLYHPLRTINKPKCLMELHMVGMSQEIRSKPKWFEKILQLPIVAKWKSEAIQQGLTLKAVDYVIDELKYYATLGEGCIEPGPIDGSWKADGLVDKGILKKLKEIVEKLENVPEEEKDYHPGSEKLVVDLVHPSLYCYVEGRSVLVNKKTIDPSMLPIWPKPQVKVWVDWKEFSAPSGSYRWLPAEVSCGKDGEVTFDTYINNLHPKQHDYEVIARILEKFIPMFSRSLTDVINWKGPRIDLTHFDWYGNNQPRGRNKFRPIKSIPIPKFNAPAEPAASIDLRGEKLQVIVKMANIELTPEKPNYNGGSWHVEGIDEERIVATGIYYYDMKNITESKLMFRQSVEEPRYEQNDDRGVKKVFGLENAGPLNQDVGNFTAVEGRCIVFPNVYQHKVAPFQLVDNNKPGHRKILVFFLVDPTVKIISTNNVLPQQPNWNVIQLDAPVKERKTMTREEAEEMREKLMFERKYAQDEFQKAFYEREFSLCEH